ncbi:winged helix-turn-helix transcriptional regulator [Micromonospora endolithica]|uniref:DNA-binding response regulator n=1 Tax=Micromonospora endolithica TaxID=230091 RepID=A0A3A9YTN4_9ACTN|nr:response regulator transcription factor [Micromonospora endolithica]RKN39149.1 DNA-binding response regulator [Micromonospora endolithica]TWJ25593.1 DNA-binding response OmpR family regulator [Micromonospora endolithica]
MNNLADITRGDSRSGGRFVLLVLDDDQTVGADLVARLADHGVHAHHFAHAAEALLAAGVLQPDAAVVAAGLATMSSIDLAGLLTGRAGIPTIVGVGDDDGSVVVAALKAGATACVRRPYRLDEVVPILRGIRAETAGTLDPPVEIGGLRMNPATYEVTLHGRPVALPLKEFKLLYFFMTHADRTVTREQLLSAVWNGSVGATSNTLTVHIKRLRQRLMADGRQQPMIVTVRGLGYRLVPCAVSTVAE